jgi:hypothetical protein
MQSLKGRARSFGIDRITVNPGFFRTELLSEQSTNFADRKIEDYNDRRTKQVEFWKGYNGQQYGDPRNSHIRYRVAGDLGEIPAS